MKDSCSIIVSSCDNFSDVWNPFFTLFFRYWPDCPFKIYLISETKTYPDSRVSAISLGEDKKWATNIKLTLQKINTPYFIYLQEDYLLKSPVNTKRIISLLDFAMKNNAGCLRLFPAPEPDEKLSNNPDLGEITKGKLYSVSLQAAIWKKEVFESILMGGETGWNMEFDGSKRSVGIKEPFLSVYDKALDYPNKTAIKKGMWLYDAVKLCEKEGIKIDRTKRKVETKKKYILRKIDKKGFYSIAKRRLFLMSMAPFNLYLIIKKWRQTADFYKLRKDFIKNYDLINKKDISKFTTEHWRTLNKKYEDYLREINMPLMFLRNKIISYTMFISSGGVAMATELRFLESLYPKSDLKKYLAEDAVGLPKIMSKKYFTSHNSIHHLYHIGRFISRTGANLDSIKTVVEWGGGYGNFAKIFLRIKNGIQSKTYIIIDTPLFSCIQWVYLSAVLGKDKINLIKKEGDLLKQGMVNIVPLGFIEKVNIKADLFVSTWALSESSMFSQNYVLSKNFFDAEHILIGYQKSNLLLPDADRINSIIGKKVRNIINEPIDFLPGNNYLFK